MFDWVSWEMRGEQVVNNVSSSEFGLKSGFGFHQHAQKIVL